MEEQENQTQEKKKSWLEKDRLGAGIILILLVVVAAWGMYTNKKQGDYQTSSENQYTRAFYELVEEVQNVEISLAKAMVSNSPKQKAVSFSEVWRDAGMAEANLSQIPVSQLSLENTSKFLNQVSDYSYTLLKQSLADKDVTSEQYTKLKELHEYATTLQTSLGEMSTAMGQGRIKWGDLSQKTTQVFSKAEQTNYTTSEFEGIEKDFKEYPTLIYDGPFSDDLKDITAKGITGDIMTEEQLMQKVKNFVGSSNVKEVKLNGITESNIKTYNYEVIPKNKEEGRNNTTLEISETGGHIISVSKNKNVVMESLSIDQAKEKAKQYLEEYGFSNFRETYYMKDNGIATINYAYTENGITIYPDIIKVKVALDDGEFMGYDARGYYLSHTNRQITEPKVTEEQATAVVNPNLGLKYTGIAIIPTETKQEVLTYEFKGNVDKRDFLVYINAETGEEEKILIIIDTPNGTLTM